MDSLLPSEIARLVLGYLEEECEIAAQSLLENCGYLQECYLMARQGKTYSTRPYSKSLKQVLEEYCAIRSLVSDRLKKLPESSAASLAQCSLVEQLSHLMGLSRSGQTLLVSITMPPQGSGSGTAQASTTPPLGHGRARSRQSSSAERFKRLAVRWQGGEAQQPPQEVEHVTSVEATPAKSLPGLSSSEDVEIDRNVPSQVVDSNEGPSCPHLDDSEMITPIGSGSCTSTPKRRPSCSKRKTTLSTKGSPSSVKRVTSPARLRRSLSEEDANECINLTLLTQAFLENKELHQKIAENINKVIGAEQQVSQSTEEPVETSCRLSGPVGEVSQEMDSVIKTIVEQTEQDPLFERFLEDLIAPVDPLVEHDAERETGNGEASHPRLVTTPEADNCSATPKTNELDVPLKQRLRNARHKKDSDHVETPMVQKDKCSSQVLENKMSKGSQHSGATVSGSGESDSPVSLEHQNAVAIESIVNANVFSPNKQSPPVLHFNTTLGHLISNDVPDASHDHNTIMSASCIDRLTKEVACLQSEKYPFIDGNVSLPSFGGSFNLGSDTLKTLDNVKCVVSQSAAKDSSELLHKPSCSSGATGRSLSKGVQQTILSRFPGEGSVGNRNAHGSVQQGTNVTSLIFSENVTQEGCNSVINSGSLVGGKAIDSADQILLATPSNDSCKPVYNVVHISSQPNTEGVHSNFPSSFSAPMTHTAVFSGSRAVDSNPVSVVTAGNQQPVCNVVSVMPQQIMSSSNKQHLGGGATDSNKICFPNCCINIVPSVGYETSDLAISDAGGVKTASSALRSFPHLDNCSNLGLPPSFLAGDSGKIVAHVAKPIASATSQQLHATPMGQVLSVNISEGDGTMVGQSSTVQVVPISLPEKGTVSSISQPVTGSQLMDIPMIQLINILKPSPSQRQEAGKVAFRPRVPVAHAQDPAVQGPSGSVVPVASRKKGYIPILPKKEQPVPSKKLIVIPSSASMSQESVGQQLVMVPPAANGESVTVYSYPLSEEPVHFSDSNPSTQSLPTICLESPVAKDTEGRERLLGALNLLESNSKESANISESVTVSEPANVSESVNISGSAVSPQLMKLVDLSKNTISPTVETVSANEANLSATNNNIVHDLSIQEIYSRSTPTISSGLKQKASNSRRLSLSTPRRRRSHIRTLDFNTPLKPTSVRKSNTSPKVFGKVLSQASSKLAKSVRRMSLFKSPVNRIPTRRTATEGRAELDTAENTSDMCPIATRSPVPALSGSWDKVTGVGLIIPESSSAEESEPQTKHVVNVGKKHTESGITSALPLTQKKLGTWDSALRALLSPNYEDPEPPSKSSRLKKESKCSKKVTAEATRRTGSKRCKNSKKESANTSLVEGHALNTTDIEEVKSPGDGILPQMSKGSKQPMKKLKNVLKTSAKQNVSISVQSKNTSLKGIDRKIKNKQTAQSPYRLRHNKRKSPLKSNIKRELESNSKTLSKSSVKSPLKSNVRTPLKKTPFKSKASTPLEGKASMLIKSKKVVREQSKQKSKVKLPDRILKVCVENMSHCNFGILGDSNAMKKTGNDKDNNVVTTKSSLSKENMCSTVDNVANSIAENAKLSENPETENVSANHMNNTVLEKNKSYVRKQRKNPSPSKNIQKLNEKENDGIVLDCEKKLHVGVMSTVESTTSKVVQSPTNLKAAKRTLVRNQLMAGRKLDLSEEHCEFNTDVAEPVSSCSQGTRLDTPEKVDTGIDVSLMIPMTPRIISPKLIEDTPITKLIKEQIATYEDTIMTPNFPCTPNIPVTPRSLETGLVNEVSPSGYSSRPTDYSSCSSYYQPSDDPNHQHKSLEQVLIDECCRMEANEGTDECEKTETVSLNAVTVPDDEQTNSCKPAVVGKESKQQNGSSGESTAEEHLQTPDESEGAAGGKSIGETTTAIQESAFASVENRSGSEVQDDKICSRVREQSDAVKQCKQITEEITSREESDCVTQKDAVVDQTEKNEIQAEMEIYANTTELSSGTSLLEKTIFTSQQGKDNDVQGSLTEANVAVVKQNSESGVDFVIEEENSGTDDSIDDDQSEEKTSSDDEDSSTSSEDSISRHEDVQKEQTENECVQPVGRLEDVQREQTENECVQSAGGLEDVQKEHTENECLQSVGRLEGLHRERTENECVQSVGRFDEVQKEQTEIECVESVGRFEDVQKVQTENDCVQSVDRLQNVQREQTENECVQSAGGLEDVQKEHTENECLQSVGRFENVQKEQTENECVQSVAAGHSASQISRLDSDHINEEVTDCLQQSCLQSYDIINPASSENKDVNVSDECSKQAEKLPPTNKTTNSSCARTSVFNFTGKFSKVDSKNNRSYKKLNTKHGKKPVETSDSAVSSSEESVSDEEKVESVNSMTRNSSTSEKPSFHSDVTSITNFGRGRLLSNELFGNCSDESGEDASTYAEDTKETEAVIHSGKCSSIQKTREENNSKEPNTSVTATSQSQDPVRNILGTDQDNVSGSNTTHNVAQPNMAQNATLLDGKLWLELEEKRLRTLAKLKELPKAKRRTNVTEVSSKQRKEKCTESISKMPIKVSKQEETETLPTAEATKKMNRLRKQGVNAIAERLRNLQQAVDNSVSKLPCSQEDLCNRGTPLSNPEVELQLARMYGDLETDAGNANVQSTDETIKAKLSSEISPVRNLEDILSNTVCDDKTVKRRKRRYSNLDGRGSKKRIPGCTIAKFPKLSLKDSSVRSGGKQDILEVSSNIMLPESDKSISPDRPVNKVNTSGKKTKFAFEKEIVSTETIQCADRNKNVSSVDNVTSNSRELVEMVRASPDSDAARNKSTYIKECARKKEIRYSDTDIPSHQAASVDELPGNTHISGSNVALSISHLSKMSMASSNAHGLAGKSAACETQSLDSNTSSLKLSNKSALSLNSCKSSKVKTSSKSKNAVLGNTHTMACASNKKDRRISSSLNSSGKIKKKENIVNEEKRLFTHVRKSSKEEVYEETNTVVNCVEESASVAHISEDRSSSPDVCDTKQYKRIKAPHNTSRNKLRNLKINSSDIDRKKVFSEVGSKVNNSQSCEHEEIHVAVLPKPPVLDREDSSVKQCYSNEYNSGRETDLEVQNLGTRETSQGERISSRLRSSTRGSTTKENICHDNVNEMEAEDKQKLVIDKETYVGGSLNLLVDGSITNEGTLLSEKNRGTKSPPAQDNVRVPLVRKSMSPQHSLETEVPEILEDYISFTEKLMYVTYKSNGPHLQCEPSSVNWNDCAVKLLVDDFEVTCSVTPHVELLDISPAVADDLCAKECDIRVNSCKSKENENEGTNKFDSKTHDPGQCGSSGIINKINLLRVPKKVKERLSEDTEMISPLTSVYNEGLKKEKFSSKNTKRSDINRLGIENDKEKRHLPHYPRRYDYSSYMERHRRRLGFRKKPYYASASSTRNTFYRRSTERRLSQVSGSHRDKSKTPGSSKRFDDAQEGRHRLKYDKYVSSSRSKSTEKPYFHANRKEETEDHHLRGRDSSHTQSAKKYVPEAFDGDADKRPESKYNRHRAREDHHFHKKNRDEVLEETERSHVRNKQPPSTVVDEIEERTRSRHDRYSSSNRTSNVPPYSRKKIRDEMYEREMRVNHSVKNSKHSSVTSRSESTKEGEAKIQHSRLSKETKVCAASDLSKTNKDSSFEEMNAENPCFSKTSKQSFQVTTKGKNGRGKGSHSGEFSGGGVSEQFCPERSRRDISESDVSDDGAVSLCNSDSEQEMQSFRLEKSPVKQMCDDDLMTYALIGSPARTQQIHSSEQIQRGEHAVENELSSTERSMPGGSIVKEDVRNLPPKKRKASSEEMSHVEKRECLESTDPQTLLKKVGLEKFLSVVHGEETQP